MIGYVTLGTNRFDEAAKYYDELFTVIGAGRVIESDRFIAWGRGMTSPAVSIAKPFDGEPATVGNGVMIALVMDSRDKVDAVHARALELGGTDEGAPGQRGEQFYAAYFRDLDGNKLNAFCMTGG
jgi:catechol-2,3-dioxygenase